MAYVEKQISPGRPRDPSIEPRVLEAAVEELAEHGVAGFSVNQVAARAQVDKRSIYNRWSDRTTLLTDAIATLVADVRQPDTGALRSDLEMLMPTVAAVYTSPRLDILTRALREAREDPDVYAVFERDLLDHNGAIVEHAFREADRRGELREGMDPAWAADAFFGLVMARGIIRRRGTQPVLDEDDQRAIIDYLMGTVSRSEP